MVRVFLEYLVWSHASGFVITKLDLYNYIFTPPPHLKKKKSLVGVFMGRRGGGDKMGVGNVWQ